MTTYLLTPNHHPLGRVISIDPGPCVSTCKYTLFRNWTPPSVVSKKDFYHQPMQPWLPWALLGSASVLPTVAEAGTSRMQGTDMDADHPLKGPLSSVPHICWSWKSVDPWRFVTPMVLGIGRFVNLTCVLLSHENWSWQSSMLRLLLACIHPCWTPARGSRRFTCVLRFPCVAPVRVESDILVNA